MADNRMLSEEPSARFAREQEEARRKERAAQDAEWIRTHGAVPGTPKWYKITAEANEVERLTRNRDNIANQIREMERPESYTVPEKVATSAKDQLGKDFMAETGIHRTPEGTYTNVGSVAGQRAKDSLTGAGKYNRLRKELDILESDPKMRERLTEYTARKDIDVKYKKPEQTAEEKMQDKKDLETFKFNLGEKYKDTPEGKLAKQKDLAEYKSTLPGKDSDFKWAYSMRRDESQTPGEFRNKVFAEKSAPGTLTENTVLKTISDQSLMVDTTGTADTVQGITAKWYGHYQDTRKKNPKMSREEAMNRTLQEMTKIALPSFYEPGVTKESELISWLIETHGMTDAAARNWIRSQ